MGVTQTEKAGYVRNEIAFLEKEHDLLARHGLPVDDWIRDLKAKLQKAVDANARQEQRKRALKADTDEVEATHEDLYRTASGYLDAAIGVLGKGSEATQNMQRIRSRIRMPGDQTAGDEATAPGGTPPGAPS